MHTVGYVAQQNTTELSSKPHDCPSSRGLQLNVPLHLFNVPLSLVTLLCKKHDIVLHKLI